MSGTRRSPGPARRLRDHLAWRRQQFEATTGTQLFIDRHHDAARSLYLASWPRSGSTWLAELIASARGTRLVFEPCNLPYPGKVRIGTELISLPAVAPSDDLGPAGSIIEQAVHGVLRTHWSDQLRTTRVASRRVVKEIVTVPALPWVAAKWPEMPMILLLRHPVAVADSLVSLTWSMNNRTDANAFVAATAPGADPTLLGDALLGEVAQWANEHSSAIAGLAQSRALVVFYESLLADPSGEIERIRHHLESSPPWRRWEPDPAFIHRPSFASFRRREASADERSRSWLDAWGPATLAHAEQIVGDAGLGHLYGRDGLPACDPDQVLAPLGDQSAEG